VEIFADVKIRYGRIIERRENPDDASKTFEQFLLDHERSTEISIPEVIAEADERIDNNGDEEYLHLQLDALIKKYCC
jgi:dephospho-CoA kinase